VVDRIRPLKFESPDSGGTQTDDFPTGTNPNEDFVDSRGVTIQNDSSDDDDVRVSRDSSDNMTFLDKNTGPHTLTALTSGGFDFNNIIWDVAGGVVYDVAENAVTKT